jgi:hypothetical protein
MAGEALPSQTNEDIGRRELASVEVTDVTPEQGSFLARADEAEGIELIRRLISDHYGTVPGASTYWQEQLDGIVRQNVHERETGRWSGDYAVFLLDEPRSTNEKGPSWIVEMHALGMAGKVGITFRRSDLKISPFSAFSRGFPRAIGKFVVDRMQDKVLAAMQSRG